MFGFNMQYKYNVHHNKSAFSLVEVSMVLVIIALIAVTITSIASLIETAKIRSFINLTENWKKSISTFYSMNGRLPGNTNNSYYIGELYYDNWVLSAKQNYIISDFGLSSYDGLSGNADISSCSAFWLDLYLAKVNNFRPEGNNMKVCGTSGASPTVFNEQLRVKGPKTIIFDDNRGMWPQFHKAAKGVFFQFVNLKEKVKSRIFYKIDQKLDDGLYNEGNLRSFCFSDKEQRNPLTSIDYKTAINNNYTCPSFYYKLIDYNML